MPSRNATRLHKQNHRLSQEVNWCDIVQNLNMVAFRTLSFIRHPIYGSQNQVAQAVLFVQNGTLGKAY